jgi:hypothetical protein
MRSRDAFTHALAHSILTHSLLAHSLAHLTTATYTGASYDLYPTILKSVRTTIYNGDVRLPHYPYPQPCTLFL